MSTMKQATLIMDSGLSFRVDGFVPSKESDFEWRSSVLFLVEGRKFLLSWTQHYYVQGPLWCAKAINLKWLTDYFTEAQTFWIVLVFVLSCDFTVYG